MFTGIITAEGTITRIAQNADGGAKLHIRTSWDCAQIPIGASIACNGVCLTLVEAEGNVFAADASAETLRITTMKHWQAGQNINLERALAVGDELGGHIVSGHIDGVAQITAITKAGDGAGAMEFELPQTLAPYIAPKGSIALDGVSLTINEVKGRQFSVMVIPHTGATTNLGKLAVGDEVNVEVDLLARYVARMRAFERAES